MITNSLNFLFLLKFKEDEEVAQLPDLPNKPIGAPVLPPLHGAKVPDQLVAEAFDVANQAQHTFNYVLGPTEPYKTLSQNIDHLEQPDSQLTEANANLLGQIKTSFLNGFDSYDSAVQTLREFCTAAPQTLQSYLNYHQQSNPSYEKVKNRNLLRFLDNLLQKYGKGQKAVHEISTAFGQAFRHFKALVRSLKSDYNENSPYFKNRVSRLIGEQPDGSEQSNGSGSGGGLFSLFGSSGSSSGSGGRKVDKEKVVAELKLKLANILSFYENYYKEVQKAVHVFNQSNSAFTAEVHWLESRKAQIEALTGVVDASAPAGEHNDEYHNAVHHSGEALIASCQEYLHQHP